MHKILSPKELKNRKYYKCHHSYNHATVNYMVFKNAIQKALKDRRFNLADKEAVEMIVDTNPFLNITTNMILATNLTFYPQSNKGKQLTQK